MENTDTPSVVASPMFTIYFNGFAINLSSSDVGAVLLLDGQPQCKLKMSFTTAKTFHKHLSDLVSNLEAATDHKIMVTEDVDSGLRKLVGDSNP